MTKLKPVMTLIAMAWLAAPALAQTPAPVTPPLAPRDVPARNIPVSTTVSPQL